MEGRALLRRLTPIERNVLLLWHRHDGDAALIAEVLRGGYEDITFDDDGETNITIRGRTDPRYARTAGEVERLFAQATARLDRMARAERAREAHEAREAEQRIQPRKVNKMSNGTDPVAQAAEQTGRSAWAEQAIAIAKARRDELLAALRPITAELEQVEEVLRALDSPVTMAALAPDEEEIGDPEAGEPEADVSGAAKEAARSVRAERKRDGRADGQARGEMKPVTDELRAMPATGGRDTVTPQAYIAAERQLRVLAFVDACGAEGRGVIAKEVADALELGVDRVKDDLDRLAARDMIVRTGTNRRAEGQVAGRASIEYGSKAAPDPQ